MLFLEEKHRKPANCIGVVKAFLCEMVFSTEAKQGATVL
jgi:hypothetical protein